MPTSPEAPAPASPPSIPAWDRWIAAGAMAMALGVALGAFGAHGLEARVSVDLLTVWNTATRYHVYHALALVAVGLLGTVRGHRAQKSLRLAGVLFACGLVLFCGSLYALVVTGTRWLGAITPLGGAAWIAGWIAFAIAALSRPTPPAGGGRA